MFVDSGTNTGSSTGEIDLSASTVASYTITYDTTSSGSSVCPNTSTQTVEIAVAGIANNFSMNFDGTNDFIDVGSFSLNANAGTVSAWIKSSNTSDFQMIIGKFVSGSRQVQFRTETNGKIRLILYKSSTVNSLLDSTGTVLDGNWHHVAFTYNSSGINLYIDGSASGSNTTNITPVQASTDNFMIGARKSQLQRSFLMVL